MHTNDKGGGRAKKSDFVGKVLQGIGDDYSEYMEAFAKARFHLYYTIL